MSDLAELFDRARSADIERVAGVKLRRAGRRMRGECPLCRGKPKPAAATGGEAKTKRKRSGPSTAFSVDPVARLFKCFSCGEGGDVIRLEQQLRGGSPREAAERLVGVVAASPARTTPRPSEPRRAEGARRASPAEKIAAELWREGKWDGLFGPIVGAYLASRGLPPLDRATFRGLLRFHPAAKWGFDPECNDWIRAPAIIGQVVTPAGPTGGVHATYLRPDGRGKAALEPAKRMWGPQRDAEGRPGCVWLSDILRGGPLIVGEGVESTLSAGVLHERPCRLAAALSLEALQGGVLTDKWGRIDPAAVTADPERPAFTWPDQDEVLVAVDRDMKPILRKVRKVGGGTGEIWLDAETRARICAGLAVQAWKRAGAKSVRAIAPGAGRDFNDELRERAGG